MNRCAITLIVLCTLGILLLPVPSDAQQTGNIPRIGVLGDAPSSFWDVFRQGLRELGYVEGENLIMEYR